MHPFGIVQDHWQTPRLGIAKPLHELNRPADEIGANALIQRNTTGLDACNPRLPDPSGRNEPWRL
jgi:hypothetical protein